MKLIKIANWPSNLHKIYQHPANIREKSYKKYEHLILNTECDITIHSLYGIIKKKRINVLIPQQQNNNWETKRRK